MTVHRKCAIVLVILCARRCLSRSAGSDIGDNMSEDTEEDGKISQALVLVDLLKHEYVKALRENYELRKGTTVIEESTCAPSDEPSTSGGPSDQHLKLVQPSQSSIEGRRMAGGAPQPFRQAQNFSYQPYQLFRRRRIPVDYYYDGADARGLVFYRRHEVKPDEAELETTKPATKVPVTTETAVKESITTGTAAKEPITTGTAAGAPGVVPTAAAVPKAYRRQNQKPTVKSTKITSATEAETPAHNEAPDNTEDPVQAQVISEMKSELKGTQLKGTFTNTPARKGQKTVKSKKQYLQLIKPTLKIHLGGSTRYPLPLPENHAFCYTNPRNALCRTSI